MTDFSDYLEEVNLIQTVSFMARNLTENEEELILIFVQLNYADKNILLLTAWSNTNCNCTNLGSSGSSVSSSFDVSNLFTPTIKT